MVEFKYRIGEQRINKYDIRKIFKNMVGDFKKKINHLDNAGGQLQQKSAGTEPHYDTLFDNLAANKSEHDDEVVGM